MNNSLANSIIEILAEKEPIFLSLLPVLISIWLGYRLGLLTYFQKREHEQIIQRYLEQGVDLISSNVDHALGIFKENWALSLRMLREFNGSNSANIPMRKESLAREFIMYDPKSFSISPFYKIKSLVGDDAFWEATQLLFAFVGTTYDFFENDLKYAIQAFYREDVPMASAKKIYEGYMAEVRSLNEKSEKYYKIIMELQNLAIHLETKPLTFKDIVSFKKKPEAKEIIKRLRSELIDKVVKES